MEWNGTLSYGTSNETIITVSTRYNPNSTINYCISLGYMTTIKGKGVYAQRSSSCKNMPDPCIQSMEDH